jgi:hypothetical protein
MQNTELLLSGEERTLFLFERTGGSPPDISQAGAFTTAYCRYVVHSLLPFVELFLTVFFLLLTVFVSVGGGLGGILHY